MNRIFLMAASLVLLFCPPTRADLTLEFSVDNGSTYTNTHTLTAGNSVSIEVYLRDSDAAGVLVNDGLFGYGLRGTGFDTSNWTRQNSAIDSVFDFSVDSSTDTEIRWNGAVFNNAAPTGQDLLLGSFDLLSLSTGTTILSFSDIDPGTDSGNNSWVSGTGSELDQLIFDPGLGGQSTYNLTIIAVPEPSYLCIVMAICGCKAIQRRRP